MKDPRGYLLSRRSATNLHVTVWLLAALEPRQLVVFATSNKMFHWKCLEISSGRHIRMKQKQPRAAFLCLYSLHEGSRYISFTLNSLSLVFRLLEEENPRRHGRARQQTRSRPQDLLALFGCVNKPRSYKLCAGDHLETVRTAADSYRHILNASIDGTDIINLPAVLYLTTVTL